MSKVEVHWTGCWNWTAALGSKGYAHFWDGQRDMYGSRFAWILFKGPIPADTPFVLHKCDNPKCVKPDHLFLGTQKDNLKDCCAKGRIARGERAGGARLKRSDIDRLIALRMTGVMLHDIAATFKISKTHVEKILAGKKWAAYTKIKTPITIRRMSKPSG